MRKKSAKITAAVLAAAAVLSACGGSGSNTTTAAAGGSDTSAAETTAAAAVADENATYKEELHIAVAQQAPSLDLHKNSTLIASQMMDGTVWEKMVT